VDSIGPDQGLKAGRRLLDTRGRLGEGDKSLRTEAETGESETTYRKPIAGDVVPFGVCLKRWLARLHHRWWRRRFRNGRPGRAHSAYDENGSREAYRDEQKETLPGHEPVVCGGSRQLQALVRLRLSLPD